MISSDTYIPPIKKSRPVELDLGNPDDCYISDGEDEDQTSPSLEPLLSPILDSAGLSISVSQDGFSTKSPSRLSPLPVPTPWYDDSNQPWNGNSNHGNNSEITELPTASSPKGPAPPTDFALFHQEMTSNRTVLQTTPQSLKYRVSHVEATTTSTEVQSPSNTSLLTPAMASKKDDFSPVPLETSKSNAWDINLTLLELRASDCCDECCLQNMDTSVTGKARILWDEQAGSDNDKLLRMLPNYRLPGNHNTLKSAFALKVLTHKVCYKAFGSVYNIRRTHLFDRMREVKDGVLRFSRKVRTSVTDLSIVNEIRSFMNRMANVYSEMMPHSGKRIIPLKKVSLWEMFTVDTACSCSYKHFSDTFDLYQNDIQLIQKTTQFSCAICLMLQRDEDRLPRSKEYNHERELISQQQTIHFGMHMQQRDIFMANMVAARNKLFNTEMMMLTDGMDQRKSQLPTLVDDLDKETDRLECHIFGCFTIARQLKLWIDFKQISHNSNQNLTCMLNCIILMAKQGPIPRGVLRLQLDNTCSQNKNQIVMAFLALLVVYGIFQRVEIDYLPVGHTHNDIDRIFGYFAKKFKKLGNPTLEQMLFNMRNSHIDRIDDLVPDVELMDETWGIDVWMKKHTYGLKYLADYHGFQISKYPELKGETVNVGLKYKRWLQDEWSAEVKPLFHSLPVGKPPMEFANYKKKINVKKIETTLRNLTKYRSISDDERKQWDATFEMIKKKTALWQSRRKLLIPKESKKQKLEYVVCDWKEWGLDELIRIAGDAPIQKESKPENDDGYNEEHTILNQFMPRYPEPVINLGENKVRTHQTIIQRDHVDPGKYAILLADLDDCMKNKWRPVDVPWVVRILSRVNEDDDSFSYVYIPPVSETAKVKKYQTDILDPDVTEAKREYFDSIRQLFVKSTGFNPSGSLKSAILNEYITNKLTVEATKEYDRVLGLV